MILFIADYAINASLAEEMMAIPCVEIARKIVDINVPRAEVVRIFSGLTPAKIATVMDELNIVEMMMGIQKMRARRTPSNQAHVTNMQDNPVLMAADAAEATYYGFDEIETTVAVFNYGPDECSGPAGWWSNWSPWCVEPGRPRRSDRTADWV